MTKYQFKTNINCGNCIAKASPFLEIPQIKFWHVDTSNPNKILTIETDLSFQNIQTLIADSGFKAEAVGQKFWADPKAWNRASLNTLNCLIGCSLGDFSMMIYLQLYHPELSMWTVMVAAMVCGLATSVTLETIILKIREKFTWPLAFQTAMTMSFASMLAMELSENLTDYALTGGEFHAHQSYYWFALIPAMAMGFLVPLPYNYYKLKKYDKACH